MDNPGARVVVALSPPVYATAAAQLLRGEGFDDVVVGAPTEQDRAVSIVVADGSCPPVDAEVVIQLPGTGDAGEQVVLDLTGRREPVFVEGPVALLAYLRAGWGNMRPL